MSHTSATLRLSMLETMMLIRAYEERLAALRRHVARHVHRGRPGSRRGRRGARAEPRDRILTNHRSAGHLLARGADPGRLIAEVMGRVDGYCKGKSGSLHISVKELGVVLTSTIVGGELSLAPGVALAQKMGQGRAGRIVAVFFGDGAACEGIFHESLNLAVDLAAAAALRLREQPVAGVRAPRRDDAADGTSPSGRAAYGIAGGARVDGNDVEAVHAAARDAVASIRARPAARTSWSSTPTASAATSSPTTRPMSIRSSWRAGSARSDRRCSRAPARRTRDRRRASSPTCEQRVGATDRSRPRVRSRTRPGPTPASSPPTSTPDSPIEEP